MFTEIARSGLGAIPASELVYAATTRDSQNMTLDASTGNNYTVNLALPVPARAFWSLTLYEAASMLLVNNTINRYSIGDNVSAFINMLHVLFVMLGQICAVLCCAVLCCAVLCCAVSCCAVSCSTKHDCAYCSLRELEMLAQLWDQGVC